MNTSPHSHLDTSFYRQLLDTLELAVFATNAADQIVYWNRRAAGLLGWAEADVLGQPFTMLLPEHTFTALSSAAGSVELPLLRSDHTVVSVRLTRSPATNTADSPFASVFTAEASALSQPPAVSEYSLYHNHNDDLMRNLLNTLPVGVWVANKDGEIILNNPADDHIWANAHAPARLNGRYHKAWMADTGQLLALDDWALARAIRNGDVTLNEILEIETANGERKTILNSAAPIRSESGEIIGGIAVNQDITEQRRVEQAERQQRTFANALSNITAVLTSSLDLQTVMERILDNAGRVVPHEAGNIMLIEDGMIRVAFWRNYGPKCDALFRTNRYPFDMPMLLQMMETGLPQLVGDTYSAPDWVTFEETAWVRSCVAVPIRSRDTILGFLSLDSSEPDFFKPPDAERLRAFAYQAAIAIENARLYSTVSDYARELETRVAERTEELRQAKEQVEAILEHSSDGIALVTQSGAILQVNPSFQHLFDFSDLTGEYPNLSGLMEPDAWNRVKATFRDVRAKGDANRIDILCHRVSGDTFDADIAIAPLYDPATDTHFYICNVRDVTQQKTAERELRSALRKEKELSELKTRFVAMVSHEFRTPLALIQTSTDLLYSYYDRISSERRNELIMRIQSQIQQLTTLLEDVLTVAKADTVGLVLDFSIVDVHALCQDVIASVMAASAEPRQITLKTDSGTFFAEIDRKLFGQVFTNLLSNALKFSAPDQQVQVSLTGFTQRILIQVRDYGIGISPNDLPNLFDAFYRAPNAADYEGTGLGLAVVRRAVDAHHGTITVESAPGKGSTFTVAIPRKQPPTASA